MRFTSQLQHLNASTTSAIKAANFALKYSEFSDDLHSCIIEQLEKPNNMNNRANIMYFLPFLCDIAKAQDEMGYIRMMERDILRIIDLVAPDDGSGAANVKVVRKVLQQLQQKTYLHPQTVVELEECLTGRDDNLVSSPHAQQAPPELDGVASVVRSTPQSTVRDPTQNSAIRLDKRQIEQRIEEDRERHKRAREGIWAIPQTNPAASGADAEVERMWDEVSDLGDDDYKYSAEALDERRRCFDFEET